MDEVELNCEIIISHMLPYELTIRQCEEDTGISRSTIHRTIHKVIRYRYPSDYQELVKLLENNKVTKFRPRRSWL